MKLYLGYTVSYGYMRTQIVTEDKEKCLEVMRVFDTDPICGTVKCYMEVWENGRKIANDQLK